MKTIHISFKGITPLIMHSCRTVNPLDPISIAMKKINAKKNKKTDEDLIQLSDLDWEGGLYWNDAVGGLYIPAENIEATVREGAKARRKGKDIERAFNVTEMMVPLNIGEDLTKEQLKADNRFRDVRSMKVMKNRIIRTRPRFNMWQLDFDAIYDETVIDLNDVVYAIEYAGQYVGLCDSRPKYGKFVASITEIA